ncbi:protein SRC2 [Brachypodium distachyon]|uniref:C2 domain-containing protein n=1 Tax=Brachypodium distachyon TaxID=15368 RepID=I1HLU4_BRADI|nr:protein SRC2 [Brachypodium distachyon]KQK07507.1 hypothetical protein BRADI_2g35890v3 [Brachypodium distachyon]|eukprot:XP_003566558.1 protein SRC2 [Brachypodium distachyon]
MASYRVLEVTLISAKDLKKVTVFSKMRVYAVASISGAGADPRTPTHRTHADRQGGRSPMWHAPLRFPVPCGSDPRDLALHVLLRAERAFGDRDVGEVFVPLRELVSAAPPPREQRHLSYQVRRPMNGRKTGVLHISYSLSDVVTPPAMPMPVKGAPAPVTAYPPPPYGYTHGHPSYGYGAPGAAGAATYGYGAPAAAPARQDGGGSGFGMGLLGAAVAGMMMGIGEGAADVIIDAEMGMDGGGCGF